MLGRSTIVSAAAGAESRRELTSRGLLLGVAIALVFTAAHVCLGFKVGLTFLPSGV